MDLFCWKRRDSGYSWIGGIKNVDLIKEFGGSQGFWKAFSEVIEYIRVEDGKLAKEKLGGDEFNQVANAVLGLENLMSSAPKFGGIADAIGGLASSLGGGAGQLGNLAALAGGFKI